MPYFLAVDAGGTKTDYVLADDTAILARTRSGTIKRMRTDAASATSNLDDALTQLVASTGISLKQITQTCVGTAGETVPLVTDWIRDAFSQRVSGELLLLGDVEIALDAAFPGQPGVLVMAGTGSNVAGRTPTGKLTTAGGWGPALADQGSGYRIGSNALRDLFLAIDEGKLTLLQQRILDFWQLPSVDALVAYANQTPPPDYSQLVETVLQATLAQDAVAREVLQREGRDLAHLVLLVMRRLQRAVGDTTWTPPVAFTGSILQKVAPVREAMLTAIQQEFPSVDILKYPIDPIHGALWRARSAAISNVPA